MGGSWKRKGDKVQIMCAGPGIEFLAGWSNRALGYQKE